MVSIIYTSVLLSILYNFCNYSEASIMTLETVSNPKPKYNEMFMYEKNNRTKVIIYDQNMANEFVNAQKPKGLHKTCLDLDFPQLTSSTTTIYRVIQYILNGGVTDLQRELYKDVEFKLTGKEVRNGVSSKCHVDIVLKLTQPSNFGTDGTFTPQDEGMEKVFKLEKNQTVVVKFENVFDDDFPMDHFWANFSIRGKCNMYLDVELLKPNNTTETL